LNRNGPDSHDRDSGLYSWRVRRLRQHLASITITPVRIVVLGVLVLSLGLFAFDPSGVQAPAMIVGVILLIGVVGGVPSGCSGRGGWRAGSLAERRAGFHPIDRRDIAATAADRQAEEELWHEERERYAQDERSG
jgi:hypothetical protein